MNKIKQRRLTLPLSSHPELCVGECVPFYFCPRSVMLYLISQSNHPELSYCGGQEPILHLQCDMRDTIAWAENADLRLLSGVTPRPVVEVKRNWYYLT